MGRDFDSIDGGRNASMKGKVVISKAALAVAVVLTILLIVAVGLMAGLIGKSEGGKTSEVVQPSTTTKGVITSTSTAGVITATSAPPASTTGLPPDQGGNVRLPDTLLPLHYTVDLQPVLTPDANGLYWFNGSSTVEFMVKSNTNLVIIHSNKLEYTNVMVHDNNNNEMTSSYKLYVPNQFLIVTLDQEMTARNNYSLSTTFKGELSDDLGGLYRSTYTNSAGVSKVIATTQMQPTDARKSFPCFDEPALKATFDISLWHQPPNFAISNMPNISTEAMNGGWMKTTFNRTVKMSTYLLAFVVCDFDYVENTTVSDTQTIIYARPEQIANGNGDYARDITPVILDYFADFFNVSYPLPKCDQIAVPDFAAGAMENWGLVIYRETALLYDPDVNSASNKQRVAAVVAHELAHQWFGNLISPLWWDELWLNEGFASYVEYIGTDRVEPTWRMNHQFIVSDLQRAFAVDGLTSSRPILAQNVSTPADINALFDTISYSKGACILRMINEFTGDTAFKLGLKNYLDAYAYGPVDHNQLFEFWEMAVNNTSGVDNPPNGFINSMDTWILQMGYPVINMMRQGGNVQITQKRFLLDPEADASEPPSPFNYAWTVPIWYVTQSQSGGKIIRWLDKEQSTLTIPAPADEYFIGNYEAFGYYRVNYDDENWGRIINQLNTNFEAIDARSRGQIIDDAFNLARRGDVTYNTAFGLTEFLTKDFDYVPWESALDGMAYFDQILGRSKVYGVYSEYLLYLLEPVYTNVTWNDTGEHLVQFQRVNALSAACFYNYPDCVSNAQMQFAEWMNDMTLNKITPNLRTTVYCNAIRYGGVEQWDFTWDRYQSESNSQERAKLEYALSCSRTPWIIRRFLDLVLNDTFVRKQDASSILQDLCLNEYARDVTWDFVRSKWDFIYDEYGTGFFSFSGIISSCTSHFSTQFELDELEDFKTTNIDKLGTGLRTVDQSIEKTKTNIKWRESYEDVVFDWLTTKVAEINSVP